MILLLRFTLVRLLCSHFWTSSSSFNVTHHLYADDIQIYLALDHSNFDSIFAELIECLTCVQKFMDGVKLKFNPEKTEFIISADRQARESLIQKFPTRLLGNSFSRTDTVKNLGVTFHSGNTFTSHITKVCHACYYHLKDLRHIRKFLSVETAALLANSNRITGNRLSLSSVWPF